MTAVLRIPSEMTARVPWLCVVLCCVCLVCCGGVRGDVLYPVCQGTVHSATPAPNATATVVKLEGKGDVLTINCLAYEVVSTASGTRKKEKDACAIANQTDYSYSLAIRVTRDGGSTSYVDYNIHDSVGGSVAGLTMYTEGAKNYSIVFANNASSSSCVLTVRLTIAASIAEREKSETDAMHPALIGAIPMTLDAASKAKSYVVLQHASQADAEAAKDDHVTLVDYKLPCKTKERMTNMNYEPDLPSKFVPGDSPKLLTAYTATFYEPGMFRLCYRAASAPVASEVAVLSVFGGNPAYYEFTEGLSEDGRILTHVPLTIKFHGYDLDARANGDAAKFVTDDVDCESGKPAGGVPLATHLGPREVYGPNTTHTTWSFTLLDPGSYKVCYRRATAGRWAEVPELGDLGTGGTVPSPAPDVLPSPTDPATGQGCPMAPESTPEHPWVRYHGIRLTLRGSDVPSGFPRTLCDMLCIPRAALSVTRLKPTEKNRAALYLNIDCEVLTEGNKTYCSTIERYSYLVYLNSIKSDILGSFGIESAEGVTSVMALEYETVIIQKHYSLLGIIAILSLLAITAGLTVLAVQKYRDRRAYFAQFGLDDGELDDMYTSPTPASLTGGRHTARSLDNTGPIKDALIEMED